MDKWNWLHGIFVWVNEMTENRITLLVQKWTALLLIVIYGVHSASSDEADSDYTAQTDPLNGSKRPV